MVALIIASQYALPGYGDCRVWVRGPVWLNHCVRTQVILAYAEIKFSGRHRGFDNVLFNL